MPQTPELPPTRLPRPPYSLALSAIKAEGPDRPDPFAGTIGGYKGQLDEWEADKITRIHAYLSAGEAVYRRLVSSSVVAYISGKDWHHLRAFLEHNEASPLPVLDSEITFRLLGRRVAVNL